MNEPLDQANFETFCPRFHHAVELIGRRWSGAIIRAMLGGTSRFSGICAMVPGLSDRLLSERLKELESEGIVSRTVYPETPVRIEYRLTERGRSLAPALSAISEWAERWLPEEAASEGDVVETVRS
jgi:DNA-binding HxlR family transcriptional regulator